MTIQRKLLLRKNRHLSAYNNSYYALVENGWSEKKIDEEREKIIAKYAKLIASRNVRSFERDIARVDRGEA